MYIIYGAIVINEAYSKVRAATVSHIIKAISETLWISGLTLVVALAFTLNSERLLLVIFKAK